MKQSKALAILKSGKNVFLTGSAGAGKTFILNKYIAYLKERNVSVAVTASTGIAATHMGGQTIHSWTGIGIKETLTRNDLNSLFDKKYLHDKLVNVKVLVIDEISMLHKNQLELVNDVLKFFKGNSLPFGGIQVIFSGDFFQLPPIGNPNETNKEKFAFMAQSWLDASLCICYLKEQHRQKDQHLNTILNEIRQARISDKSIQLLQNTINNKFSLKENSTKLYTHNLNVDAINKTFLDEIKEKNKSFNAKTKGNPTLLESFKKSILTDEKLSLKKGAKVMFVKNNYEKEYMNGTLGEVMGFSENGFPMVKTKNKTIEAKPETWAIEDEKGKTLVSFQQVPLRLAWAITVHKSQGMTLDAAEIDLSKTFEKGQGYVALSRIKELDGLCLLGINTTALEVDELALRVDKRFQELSDEANDKWEEIELETYFDSFIVLSDGVTDANKIEKNKKIQKESKEPKKSTLILTKELVDQDMDLAEIMEIRTLGAVTIMSHLVQLKKIYPSINLDKFKPSSYVLKNVLEAYNDLNKKRKKDDPEIGLKAIYDKLKGTFLYEEIKQALLFI